MKTRIVLIYSFLFGGALFSQSPDIDWQNALGGNDGDRLRCVEQTSDGGYLLGGFSRSSSSEDKIEDSHGLGDYWIVKLGASGDIKWQNTIGGETGDQVYEIEQTTDGGFIIGGYSYSDSCEDKSENNKGVNAKDYWVVKIDSIGAIEWENTFGGVGEDFLYNTSQTSDGGYIVGGYSHSKISGDKTEGTVGGDDYDFWIIKLDADGEMEWQNDIGGSEDDEFYAILQTSDGGYIVGGESESGISGDKTDELIGEADFWILKLFENGEIEWQKTIGGTGDDEMKSLLQANDGNFILVGESDSEISGNKTENSMGDSDVWVMKIDGSGNILWQNTIGGNKEDGVSYISKAPDNTYIIAAYSRSGISGDKSELGNGSFDFWIIKIDDLGNVIWDKTIGGSESDIAYWITPTDGGGYIIGGDSESGISGDKIEANQGISDYWVIKLSAEETVPISEYETNPTKLYPNPASEYISMELPIGKTSDIIISDQFGRLVKSINNTSQKEQIYIGDLLTGIYYIEIVGGSKNEKLKFIKFN